MDEENDVHSACGLYFISGGLAIHVCSKRDHEAQIQTRPYVTAGPCRSRKEWG